MAAQRGGKRPGAGRKPGSKSRATIEAKATLSEIAKQYAPEAIETLRSIMHSTKAPAAARVAASNAIIDRGYGKPPQFTTGDATAFRRATEMTDDELANIAGRGSEGAPEAEAHPQVTH